MDGKRMNEVCFSSVELFFTMTSKNKLIKIMVHSFPGEKDRHFEIRTMSSLARTHHKQHAFEH